MTPAYRVEIVDNGNHRTETPLIWTKNTHGRPTKTNLEKFVGVLNASFQSGGCNDHVKASDGSTLIVSSAKIVRQCNNMVLAELTVPPKCFQKAYTVSVSK